MKLEVINAGEYQEEKCNRAENLTTPIEFRQLCPCLECRNADMHPQEQNINSTQRDWRVGIPLVLEGKLKIKQP